MKKILTVLLALGLTAGAFAQDWSWASKGKDGFVAVDAAKVKGDVLTSGSSTVYPLALAIADAFKGEGYKDQLSIDNIGSGAGLKRFGSGEVDFANASRPINAGETKAGEALGKGKVLEFKLALDGLVVLVNAKNKELSDLNSDELVKQLFGTAVLWSDVNPNWPKEKIDRYIPETSHGTFDYFQEKFWNDKGAVLKAASNTQRFQDYNQLVAAIAKDKNGIGFIGFAYYKESSDTTKALTYKGIVAKKETVENNTYGISRFLYTYTTSGILNDKPQAAGYLAYFLNNTNRFATKAGYFPLPKPVLEEQKKLFADTIKGKF